AEAALRAAARRGRGGRDPDHRRRGRRPRRAGRRDIARRGRAPRARLLRGPEPPIDVVARRDADQPGRARGPGPDARRAGAGGAALGLSARRLLGAGWHLVATAAVDSESATVTTDATASGRATIAAAAAGVAWRPADARVTLEAAAGAALPVGTGDGPWPEGKL